ncbi:MAG TPA: universal stress protein [Solirubrobacteraceae bacterium]|nr:universal stress protein [Solirubrobacteraceae bacterium]
MFRKIIVGVDGREGDQDAIALARALAFEAELVLAHAYPYDTTPSRFVMIGYGNALRDDAQVAIRAVREKAGLGDDVRIELRGDLSPAHALAKLAAEGHADLIVVASAHRGPVGRTLLGDVGRNVLHGAPCPVAIAPRGWTGTTPATIGVAFDGKPESQRALQWAERLARERGAELRLRRAVLGPAPPIAGTYGIDIHEVQKEMRAGAQSEIDDALAGLDPGIDAQGEAVIGPVYAVLDAFAEEVDVLVTGSRGWGTLRSVVLGSTSDRLIHHAACPVVVVPRPATQDESRAGALAESAGGA